MVSHRDILRRTFVKVTGLVLALALLASGSARAQGDEGGSAAGASPASVAFSGWAKDMVIYEIATKSFNSPGAPETGTFRSVAKKMAYLEKLGINTIWLTGNNLADPHHFYNIWTQYAVVRPDVLDPSFGTREDFRAMIKCAHRHGIRIFLDVITHGVMTGSPLIDEHPDWFSGGSWGMTDYDWFGGHADLDEWWVKTWTDYVVEDGIDGYRLDVNMYRPDLWKQIRQNALDAGHEIVILQEGHYNEVEGAAEGYQSYNELNPGHNDDGIRDDSVVWNVGAYYSTEFPAETASSTPEGRGEFYASIGISCHDNGWDDFSYGENQNPYVTEGSRAWMGYPGLLAPAIPVLFSGEEWDADYVPIPYLAGSLYGDKRPGNGFWLYGSWLQWKQLKMKEKKAMLKDTRRMLKIRKEHSSLIFAATSAQKAPVLPLAFNADTDERIPVPYIIYNDDEALLVAANPCDHDITLTVTIPADALPFRGEIALKDLWRRPGKKISLPSDGTFTITIPKDHTPRGGLSVWLLSDGSPSK